LPKKTWKRVEDLEVAKFGEVKKGSLEKRIADLEMAVFGEVKK